MTSIKKNVLSPNQITRRQLLFWFTDTRKVKPGEWVDVPATGFSEVCCDCGLAHWTVIQSTISGFRIQKTRDVQLTKKIRRRNRMVFDMSR